MTDITIAVTINITNEDEFRQSAVDYGCDNDDNIEEMVERLVISADEPPLDHGYEIRSTDVTAISEKQFSILVSVNVTDEQAMIKEVRNCYSAVWQDSDWKPESLGEAVYELLCASNERPSPDTVGFEFVDQKYLVDQAVDPTTILDEDDISAPGI
jgi:hypothetical protein